MITVQQPFENLPVFSFMSFYSDNAKIIQNRKKIWKLIRLQSNISVKILKHQWRKKNIFTQDHIISNSPTVS